MLLYALYAIFVLACIVLIISVLLQPGKADAGALFTSSVSSTAFGPRGTQTLLAKITIGSTIVFMLVALMLALGVGRPRSVLESQGITSEQTAQPTPAATVAPQGNATTPPPATTAASPQGAEATTPTTAATPAANTNTTPAPPATAASPQASPR